MRLKLISVLSFVLTLGIAAFIYVHRLNTIPSGFYVDEATVAYNAYSILLTGKDEYGFSMPVLFRLLGSYTPPLFIYVAVPMIKLFGMQPVVFRLLSGFSALGSVIYFYLLINRLGLYRSKLTVPIATFFYAISPWLVFNARLGYEVTLAYFISAAAIYYLYRALENPRYLLIGVPLFSLATYAAHTQRYLFPIFMFFYCLIFYKKLFVRKNLVYLVWLSIFMLLTQIPHLLIINSPAFWIKNARFTNQPIGQMLRNLIDQLLQYYSPKSLFWQMPDIDLQHTIPELSVMYDWLVVPYLVGVYLLFKRLSEQSYRFVLLLFCVSVLPAAFSGHFISIQRALPFLLPLGIVLGIGIDALASRVQSWVVISLFIVLTAYSLLMLNRSYFVLFPYERAEAWNQGYANLASFLKQNPNEHFVVDDMRNPRLYIELLYYLQYPPAKYQQEVDPYYREHYYQAPPQMPQYKFANVEVRPVDWKYDIVKNQIIIGDPLTISEKQAKDHCFIKVYELKDKLDKPTFVGFRTSTKNCP